MNDAQLIERLGANDRYPVDVPLPDHLTANVVLLEIERRMHMQTQDRDVKPAKTPDRRPAWLVVAVAAIVVLVLGVAAVLLSRANSDVAPADTLPPTTEASPPTTDAPETTQPKTETTNAPSTTEPAPEVSAADRAAIDGFVAAFSSGDVQAILAALSPAAEVRDEALAVTDAALPIVDDPELIDRWLRYHQATGSQLTVDSCEGRDGARIVCRGVFTNAVVEASPAFPGPAIATFEVDEGKITYYSLVESVAHQQAAYTYFRIWLDEAHPEEAGVVFDGSGRPNFSSDEKVDLWATRVSEWIASLDG
jgi:hypothetical protein